MPKLPSVSGKAAIKAFAGVGFEVVRKAGSHHVMKRDGHPNLLTVPVHGNKDVANGTLRALISAAGLTIEEFVALL